MSLYDGLGTMRIWNHIYRDEEEFNQSFGGKGCFLVRLSHSYRSFTCVCVCVMMALVMERVLYNIHWKIREFYYIDVIN